MSLLITLLAPALIFPAQNFGNNSAITPARLKSHLEFIASDEMGGRDTPSLGLDIATLYVATQLKLWGATPAGDDGTFFQNIPLSAFTLDVDSSKVQLAGKIYTFGTGFGGASGSGSGTGTMVYVGHGYMIKSKGLDPYAGLDVRGKILVTSAGMPNGVSFRDLRSLTAGTDYMSPAMEASKLGALAVITIPSGASLTSAPRQPRPARPTPDDGTTAQGVATIQAGAELASAIFAGEKISADDAEMGSAAPETPFALDPSKSVQVDIVTQKTEQHTRNVVAIVPGSDPTLKNEYVAFGAHIDHLGTATTGTGDRIYNGADDDGSGTVSILEIAHAFLTGPRPKRSCLFVWHIGEEKGLWGSSWFTNHPTVDLNKVITQLNIDMIGRSKPADDTDPRDAVLTGPNEVYVVGSTKMSTDLQKTSESVNKGFLNLGFNYKYDDPKDPEQIFYRSDHYNYAHKGIPIIFYFDGVHRDYHQPGDEVSKIDFEKMSKVARTVYATGWTLANNPKRPVVDKPLKE